jgi:hypothetical protein
MARVCLETSFFSACATGRQDAASVYRRNESVEWWQSESAKHELLISVEVLDELDDPKHETREAAIRLTDSCKLLDLSDEVLGFAEVLVNESVMPGPVRGDAIHVAACCVHGVDYLLSWNVRHLANPNKVKHLQVVCMRSGLIAPRIFTPESLWEK